MTKYLSCAETAKLIRQELKANFAGVKFSVKSHVYSMGASIQVSWVNGPTDEQVRPIATKFAGAEFDGMTDSKNYLTADFAGEKVRFGADYVFCTRQAA